MRYTPLIAVPLLALSLAGCAVVQQEPPAATVAVEEQPLFASEEEALAAAQAAYTQYLALSDQIARDGGVNPERLEGLVTNNQLKLDLDAFQAMASAGNRSSGFSSFDSFHVSSVDIGNFATYLCVDVSNSQLIDANGADVTPPSRASRWPLMVSFTFDSSKKALISGSETWTGKNFC